ncbi:hypothetical protein FOZ61_004781 [Perkinsus olseni]|uniref:Uncharacterized protein n=1 Tax=Perkinsus olseni TaxID=32597 RepID=A0A7J6MCV5_PEROL|nr:hypothetical protein FOZ61_004781 [Perkinsus olseni]KAF4674580.1 hypothetical protein FOL46_004589 [Perkinsus olseni]
MLFPAHVEALRCQMVERLWKDSPAVGPLPELMSEIMACIPKPVLTLDCPTEEVILKISRIPDFIFAKGGVVYGVSHFESSITLQQISPPGETTTLVSGAPFSPTPATSDEALFYYAADTKHLYILYAVKSLSLVYNLLDYDVQAAKVIGSRRLPELTSGGMRPSHMVVIGDEVFVAVSRSDRSEIRHFKLQKSSEVIVVWSTTAAADAGEILHLNPDSVKPLSLNIVLLDNSITHLVPLERVREASPVVFKAKARRPLLDLSIHSAESSIVGSNAFRVRRPNGQYVLVNIQPGLVSETFPLRSSSLLTCPAASDLAGNIYFVFDRCFREQSSIFGTSENRPAFNSRGRETPGGPSASGSIFGDVRPASGSIFGGGPPASGSLFGGDSLQASASTLKCRSDYRLLRASPYLHL